MRYAYPVIFTKTEDEKNTILIEVPDLEIMTEGFGVADSIEVARDAIGLSGITLEDMNQPVPSPSEIGTINFGKSEFASVEKSYISLVDVDFAKYRKEVDNKMVRKNVTIPNWLNKAAEKEKINVSKVLQEALMEKVGLVR